jgi:hypothetical protein
VGMCLIRLKINECLTDKSKSRNYFLPLAVCFLLVHLSLATLILKVIGLIFKE